MAKNIASSPLDMLVPSSIRGDPTVDRLVQVIDPVLSDLSSETDLALILPRLGELSEDVVDFLAWQFHVDLYRSNLPVEAKRSLVQSFVAWHRLKGTKAGVLGMLEVLGCSDVEIVEYREAVERYGQAGILSLDGTWNIVSGSDLMLRSALEMANLPPLIHWAEFALRMDLSDAVRPGWDDEVRWAVDEMKPARSWPVWWYWIALDLGLDIKTWHRLALAKDIRIRYPWCWSPLDGSWNIGSDGRFLGLDGQALDGRWSLGDSTPAVYDRFIRACGVVVGKSLGKRIYASLGRYRQIVESPTPLSLDGTWTLDESPRCVTAARQAVRIASSSSARPVIGRYGGHMGATIRYPASPLLLDRPHVLDGSWGLDGRNIKPCGIKKMTMDGSWRIESDPPAFLCRSASGGGKEILASLRGAWIGEKAPRLGDFWVRGLDGSWGVGQGRPLDGSWRLDGPYMGPVPRVGENVRKLDGFWQVGSVSRNLDGSWPIGNDGPGCSAVVAIRN